MSTYVYKCLECKQSSEIEVEHSMNFIGNEKDLPKEILKQITCKKHGLKSRIPQVPHLAGSSQGTFKTEHQLVLEKQQQRKLRSRTHFKNDILPTMKTSPMEKRHFDKKLKNVKGDHEKMK